MSRWIEEFGPEVAVPTLITDEFEDVSWHNDVCPSFVVRGSMDVEGKDPGFEPNAVARLWVEHPDPECREFDGSGRYLVLGMDDPLYEGDDIAAAIAALKGTA